MAEYEFLFDGERLADHAQKANAAFERAGIGLHRWAVNMATAANVRLLRAWTGDAPPLDERPTRGEIKEWVRTTLAELDRVDTLARERSAEVEKLRGVLREQIAAHDADGAELGDERDELRSFLAAVTVERDGLLAQRDAARRERDDMAKDVAAMRSMLRAAHCERDRARRFECDHGDWCPMLGREPGGVASNDNDV